MQAPLSRQYNGISECFKEEKTDSIKRIWSTIYLFKTINYFVLYNFVLVKLF